MLALRVVFGMSILLLTAGLAVRLAGRRWSAGERHAVWTVALALSLLLPILLRFEPPVTVFTGPALEVQRMSITVGPADKAVDYFAAARFAWLLGMAGVAGWWLLGFVRVAGMVASSTEHSTVSGVAVRTCTGLQMPAVAAGFMVAAGGDACLLLVLVSSAGLVGRGTTEKGK